MLKNKCFLNIFIKYINIDIMKNIVKEVDFFVFFLCIYFFKEELIFLFNCN